MKYKRLLSVLLAMVLVLSLAPTAVFADDPAAPTHDGKVYVVGTEDEELDEDDPTLYDSGTYTRADMDDPDEYLTKQFDWTDKDAGEGVITFQTKLNVDNRAERTAVYAFTPCTAHHFSKDIAKSNIEFLLNSYDQVDIVTVTGTYTRKNANRDFYSYETTYGDIRIVTGLTMNSDADENGEPDYLDLLYGTYTGDDWANGWKGFPSDRDANDNWYTTGSHFMYSLYTGLYAYLWGKDDAMDLQDNPTQTLTDPVRDPAAIYVSFDGILGNGIMESQKGDNWAVTFGVPYTWNDEWDNTGIHYPEINYDCWQLLYNYDQSKRYFSMGLDALGKYNRFMFSYSLTGNDSMEDWVNSSFYRMWNEILALADPSLLENMKDNADDLITIGGIPTNKLWNGEKVNSNTFNPEDAEYTFELSQNSRSHHIIRKSTYGFDYKYNQSFAELNMPVKGITLTDTLSDYFDVSSTAATQIEVTAEPADGANVRYTVNGKTVVFDIANYEPGTELTFKIYVTATDEAVAAANRWLDTNGSAKLTVSVNDDETIEHPITSPKAHLERRNITVTKTWDDNGSGRPRNITVRLLANGEEVKNATLTAQNGWTYVFEDVPVYAQGEKIVYTVTEDAVKGYEATSIKETEPGVWSITNEKQSTPFENPTNPEQPDPVKPDPALNTEDHYAYIIGYPDGLVRPNGTITRAETVTIFFRMLTDASRDAVWSTTNSFTDVKEADWFNNAISTMENSGIINGYPDGSFNPNGNITRAEFAAMAIRFFQDAKVGPSKLSDTIGHWAEEAINKAQTQGLITGYPDGTFHPDQPITRAEAMTIVNRVLKRAPHKDHLLPERDMIVWPDNMDKTVWYYADVQEATNSHEYTMNGEYENWERELPVRDWEAFEKMWSNAHSASNPGEVIGD